MTASYLESAYWLTANTVIAISITYQLMYGLHATGNLAIFPAAATYIILIPTTLWVLSNEQLNNIPRWQNQHKQWKNKGLAHSLRQSKISHQVSPHPPALPLPQRARLPHHPIPQRIDTQASHILSQLHS